MEAILDTLVQFAVTAGGKLLLAIIILVIGVKLIRWLVKHVLHSKLAEKAEPAVLSFVSSFASIALYIVLIVTIAAIFGVPMASLITVLGSAGVAIGLALQGGLSNLAGGIMILFFKPFKVGDFITAAGESGTVASIDIFYTNLQTLDNKRIVIPNGTITGSVITNFSAHETRRLDLVFNVSYDSDIEKVKSVINTCIAENDKALADPAPFVRLSNHGNSALEFTVRVWVNAADYWDVNFDLKESIKKAFDANAISIPFPQMDVHVDNRSK
ncbi:MAG: mechanosensitive ion channel [Clostridia bacterium]|nr:mechanosensitive ion channel [Clostridia bacterium]